MKKLILTFTLVLLSVAFLTADVYIKTKTHTGAMEMMGQKQPAKDQLSEQWIGKDKFAQTTGNRSVIMDLAQKKLFIANHGNKTYVETSLPLDMSNLLPAQFAQMMAMMKIKITVNPNNQTKTVGSWNCSGYDVVMEISGMMPIKMNMKIWASKDVPFDWKKYSDEMFPSVMKASMGQMNIGENVIAEFKKIKGFQVASEITMNMMGNDMKVTTKVLEIAKKSAPAGVYAVPAGYTKNEKFSMADLQQR
ncbi:MAG: hypothetical protein GY950_33450 [bacterium]|nr:hypothetical protein [bacterium]